MTTLIIVIIFCAWMIQTNITKAIEEAAKTPEQKDKEWMQKVEANKLKEEIEINRKLKEEQKKLEEEQIFKGKYGEDVFYLHKYRFRYLWLILITFIICYSTFSGLTEPDKYKNNYPTYCEIKTC